jgi:mannosidase alpha-like ER degradation enhancer 1
MQTGQLATVVVDSLSAFFPGVQTLMGDLESAIKSHAVYAFQWKRYGGLPETFDINQRKALHLGYPLRPEFIESNLFLYRVRVLSRSGSACGLLAHDSIDLFRLQKMNSTWS